VITATAAVMQAARAAVEFINRETGGIDLMITAPEWAWLLRAHVADFQQAMAAEAHATTHFPGDIPPDQFALDPRVAQLATSRIPEVTIMLNQVEQWPLDMQAGDIEVYRNP
jgi:hypothetical protein